MFQAHDRTTHEVVTVFAVHKSGPADVQTKFLVHDGRAWRWLWASNFEPLQATAQRPTAAMRRPGVSPAVA